MSRAITDQQKDEVVDAYNSGLSINDAGAAAGMSSTSAMNILHDRGVKMRRKGYRKAAIARPQVLTANLPMLQPGAKERFNCPYCYTRSDIGCRHYPLKVAP